MLLLNLVSGLTTVPTTSNISLWSFSNKKGQVKVFFSSPLQFLSPPFSRKRSYSFSLEFFFFLIFVYYFNREEKQQPYLFMYNAILKTISQKKLIFNFFMRPVRKYFLLKEYLG